MHFDAKAIIDGDAQLTFGLNAGSWAFLELDVSWKSQSLICPKEIPIHVQILQNITYLYYYEAKILQNFAYLQY